MVEEILLDLKEHWWSDKCQVSLKLDCKPMHQAIVANHVTSQYYQVSSATRFSMVCHLSNFSKNLWNYWSVPYKTSYQNITKILLVLALL